MLTHTITDFETFMIDDGFHRIFRMLEKRQPGDWTPKELSEILRPKSFQIRCLQYD